MVIKYKQTGSPTGETSSGNDKSSTYFYALPDDEASLPDNDSDLVNVGTDSLDEPISDDSLFSGGGNDTLHTEQYRDSVISGSDRDSLGASDDSDGLTTAVDEDGLTTADDGLTVDAEDPLSRLSPNGDATTPDVFLDNLARLIDEPDLKDEELEAIRAILEQQRSVQTYTTAQMRRLEELVQLADDCRELGITPLALDAKEGDPDFELAKRGEKPQPLSIDPSILEDILYKAPPQSNGQPKRLIALIDLDPLLGVDHVMDRNDDHKTTITGTYAYQRQIQLIHDTTHNDFQLISLNADHSLKNMMDRDGHITQENTGKSMLPDALIITVDAMLMDPINGFKAITGQDITRPAGITTHAEAENAVYEGMPRSNANQERQSNQSNMRPKVIDALIDQIAVMREHEQTRRDELKTREREAGNKYFVMPPRQPIVIYSSMLTSIMSSEHREKLGALGVTMMDFAVGKVQLKSKSPQDQIRRDVENIQKEVVSEALQPFHDHSEREHCSELKKQADEAANKAKAAKERATLAADEVKAATLSEQAKILAEVAALRKEAAASMQACLDAGKKEAKTELHIRNTDLESTKRKLLTTARKHTDQGLTIRAEADMPGVEVIEGLILKLEEKIQREFAAMQSDGQVRVHQEEVRRCKAEIKQKQDQIVEIRSEYTGESSKKMQAAEREMEAAKRFEERANDPACVEQYCAADIERLKKIQMQASKDASAMRNASKWYEARADQVDLAAETFDKARIANWQADKCKPAHEIADELTAQMETLNEAKQALLRDREAAQKSRWNRKKKIETIDRNIGERNQEIAALQNSWDEQAYADVTIDDQVTRKYAIEYRKEAQELKTQAAEFLDAEKKLRFKKVDESAPSKGPKTAQREQNATEKLRVDPKTHDARKRRIYADMAKHPTSATKRLASDRHAQQITSGVNKQDILSL